MCERWRESFQAFLDDMGPRPSLKHSIERRDNARGYSPDNCYWATRRQQAVNRRSNHLLTHDGLTLTCTEWAERLGMNPITLFGRLHRRHWPVERALTTPVSMSRQRSARGQFMSRSASH